MQWLRRATAIAQADATLRQCASTIAIICADMEDAYTQVTPLSPPLFYS